MNLIPLNCRNCGAPLQVPGDLKHVTCMHCGTQLAIVHEGGAAYTEKLDALVEWTGQIEDKLDDLHREQKLAALDREWDKAQEDFMIRGKNGTTHLPSKGASVVAGIGGLGMGIVAMVIGFGMTSGGGDSLGGPLFILIGFAVLVVGIGAMVWQFDRADAYEKAKQRYKQRREQIRRS